MYKKLFLLLTLFILGFNLTYKMNGQNYDPCLPDCENSFWTPAIQDPPMITDVTLCGKTFHVAWRWRFACNTWYDYYFDAIGADSPSDLQNCINSSGGLGAFLNAVTEQFLILNPHGFPPLNPGDCADNWRVIKGSCWSIDYIEGVGGGIKQKKPSTLTDPYSLHYPAIAFSCTTNDCCLEFFKICIERDGSRVITQTGYLPPEDPSCEGGSPPTFCVPVCGSVYNR